MNITPNSPPAPLAPAATTMSNAFLPTPAVLIPPSVPVASTAPQITQPLGPSTFTIDYLLPRSTRVGDKLEFILVDLINSVSVLVFTHVLEDYDVFWALRKNQGVFTRGEKDVNDLIGKGITPGNWDFLCVQSAPPSPTPPPPAAPGPQTPLRTVAVSATNWYVFI